VRGVGIVRAFKLQIHTVLEANRWSQIRAVVLELPLPDEKFANIATFRAY
jgi:hypothetical protein